MARMTKDDAIEVIKTAIGKKIDDKRTKEHKAWGILMYELYQDDEALLKWIEEELDDYEKNGFPNA